MLVHEQVRGLKNCLAAMLAAKRSAGVTPAVNLSNSLHTVHTCALKNFNIIKLKYKYKIHDIVSNFYEFFFYFQEMSCNMDEHAVERQGNVVHKAKLAMYTRQPDTQTYNSAAKEFASRIARCAASKFGANFEKCCRYREQFMKELDACSKDLKGTVKICLNHCFKQ